MARRGPAGDLPAAVAIASTCDTVRYFLDAVRTRRSSTPFARFADEPPRLHGELQHARHHEMDLSDVRARVAGGDELGDPRLDVLDSIAANGTVRQRGST